MKVLTFIKSNKKKIIYALLGFFIIVQFFRIDKTNPPFNPEIDFINITSPPSEIEQMLKDACYDCHSHHSNYPWYTNVAPVSWWIKGHINEAREHLNFSTWGEYNEKKRVHKLEECIEFVEEKRMPLLSYIIAHPKAKISKEDRSDLVSWFKTL